MFTTLFYLLAIDILSYVYFIHQKHPLVPILNMVFVYVWET